MQAGKTVTLRFILSKLATSLTQLLHSGALRSPLTALTEIIPIQYHPPFDTFILHLAAQDRTQVFIVDHVLHGVRGVLDVLEGTNVRRQNIRIREELNFM